ncbi:MAG: GrpB family protein [Anaerolineae bacterium]|nr:GrpB family protein [Anaerolineae bacterium]
MSVDEHITVVDYDPRWPQQFDFEQKHVRPVFSQKIVDIQHFGSTAVPNLPAKPIIDILIGVTSLPLDRETILNLAKLGYAYLGEAGVPGRLYFRKRQGQPFNLAVVKWQSDLWRNNLIMRDYLRANPIAVQRYGRHKQELFAQGVETLIEYSERKAEMMEKLLQQALAWYKNEIENH